MKTITTDMQDDVERVARAMRETVLSDGEGNIYRLFDLLDFSGENKAHTITNALAAIAMRATREIDAGFLRVAIKHAGAAQEEVIAAVMEGVADWLQQRANDVKGCGNG